jgi:hypothetical protein
LFLFACAEIEGANPYIPGSWVADNVYREHFDLIEIDSNIGVQLYMINEIDVAGYIYHDEGSVIIQGDYSLEPCVNYLLSGRVEYLEGGFKTNCMTIDMGLNLVCAEMYVTDDTEYIEFKLLGAHFDTIVFDHYYSNQNVKNNNLPICY